MPAPVYQNIGTSTPGTNLVITTGVHSVSVGNTLFIELQVFWAGGTPALVTAATTIGGAGDVWSVAGPTQNTTGGYFQYLQCQPGTAGARTVTVTIANTNNFGSQAIISEFAGLWTLDTGATGGGVVGSNDSGTTSATWTTPSLTPSAAGDIILAQAQGEAGGETVSSGPTNGFTDFTITAINPMAYLTGAGSGAITTAWTMSAADTWSASAAAYKSTATAGTAAETTTYTGVGVGAVQVAATASTMATFTGVAAGAIKVAGTAATTATYTSTAAGAIAGTASETTTYTGAAVGVVKAPATASETASFTGAAVGSFATGGQTANFVGTANGTIAGTASETTTFTSAATGQVGAPGTAAETTTYTGSAVGVVSIIPGTGTLTTTYTGTATAAISVPATASLTATFTGVAAGASSSSATGTGALTTTYTAVATAAVQAAASGSETATLTATAVGSVNGSGATTTRPTFSDWRTTSSTAFHLHRETINERIRAALAVCVSGQNPDGTTVT